jgi:hypothetical protein
MSRSLTRNRPGGAFGCRRSFREVPAGCRRLGARGTTRMARVSEPVLYIHTPLAAHLVARPAMVTGARRRRNNSQRGRGQQTYFASSRGHQSSYPQTWFRRRWAVPPKHRLSCCVVLGSRRRDDQEEGAKRLGRSAGVMQYKRWRNATSEHQAPPNNFWHHI